MNTDYIPFAVPCVTDADRAAVAAALQSGWLTRGPGVGEFEQDFAAFTGAPYALATSSCTAALQLALHALDVGPGDEVILSTLTFVSAANVIVQLGAVPVFVDVEEDTLNPAPQAVADAITGKTRAIMPLDYAGHPCELEALLDVAGDIPVVLDAAHSVGAKVRDARVGCRARVTCFSFYATKNMTTMEGGMATTADAALAERMRRLSLHGMDSSAWARYGKKGSAFYEIHEPGYKYNMTDPQAALGRSQLQRLDAMNARRAVIAQAYTEGLAPLPGVRTPAVRPDVMPVWHLYPIRLQLEAWNCSRDELMTGLKEQGVGTSVHFIPVHTQPLYRERFGTDRGQCPTAEKAFGELISLPIYPTMTDEQVARVIAAVRTLTERQST